MCQCMKPYKIILEIFFADCTSFMSMWRPIFKEFLRLAVQSSFFLFNSQLYKQSEGLCMGLPLGPTFANIFTCAKEDSWLDDCPLSFKHALYKQYTDDIFLMFRTRSDFKKFYQYFNQKHHNINFTLEHETNRHFAFLFLPLVRHVRFSNVGRLVGVCAPKNSKSNRSDCITLSFVQDIFFKLNQTF